MSRSRATKGVLLLCLLAHGEWEPMAVRISACGNYRGPLSVIYFHPVAIGRNEFCGSSQAAATAARDFNPTAINSSQVPGARGFGSPPPPGSSRQELPGASYSYPPGATGPT
eukprot:scaffold4433_cov35-Tisochrysis_lutea.AAC.8